MRYVFMGRRRVGFAYSHLIMLLCCLAFLFSGCTTQWAVSTSRVVVTPSPVATRIAMTPQLRPTENAEAKLAQQRVLKVNEILGGMTLEQKLGQLILVEYLGQDYQASGLQ